ncbi:MAG: 3-phosphoshikimate 1-carboxyvinyltransferase [Bacillota bacterium]
MLLRVRPSKLKGTVRIPSSKSHTIRAVACASLAEGVSCIENPLVSSDTDSAVKAFRALGAGIETREKTWRVQGTGGKLQVPGNVIDVGNSGTSLYIAVACAALADGYTVFTGDEQIRSRPAQPLLDAIAGLGGMGFSTRGNGRPPLVVKGKMHGGRITLDGSKTSQYLTSLLISSPLMDQDTEICVENLIEKPYIEMTLSWLDMPGIKYENRGFKVFKVPGRQQYRSFTRAIPGDFSSATFFMCAAAVTGSELYLEGLDMNDTQGDKAVTDILRAMGTEIREENGLLKVSGKATRGGEFDLSNTPDALPALAVTACFAKGKTKLYNVAQARLKETDRIAVMKENLTAMGAAVCEFPEGLTIEGCGLKGAEVRGFGDHRVVMAMALAGLAAEGETVVDTAEAVQVTFPDFVELMRNAGAKMESLIPDPSS